MTERLYLGMMFFLLIELRHFIFDYLLQTSWMYLGKRAERGWLFPLLCHAGVNALGSFIVVYALTHSFAAALIANQIDFAFHSIIDRLKIYVERKEGAKVATGLDQSFHQLTYLLIFITTVI